MNTLTNITNSSDKLEIATVKSPPKADSQSILLKIATPLVSVVIPVYNGAKYIQTAIDSVLEQTYTNYEIIVIDDGSTDDTRQKLQPYKGKIRYIYQENQGSAAARNIGIDLAKGELIAFLDADDFWAMPEKLTKQVACFQDNPSLGCINTGWKIVDDAGKPIKTLQPWHKAPKLDLETWLKKKCVRTSAMVFRKEWLEKVGGFDEELRQSHDVDLILRLSLAGCETVWLKEETVCYRQHEENTTKNSLKQAKYVQAVLDKFFARDDVPESISKQEFQIRYHTLVWLAWYQYRAGHLDEMAKFLQKSLEFSPYLRVENISHWLNSFKRFSDERGEEFNTNSLTDSVQWQKLLSVILKFNNVVNNQYLDRATNQNRENSNLKKNTSKSEQINLNLQNTDIEPIIAQKQNKAIDKLSEQQTIARSKTTGHHKATKFINKAKIEEAQKYREIADQLRKENKFDEAIKNYSKSIELNPNLWQSLHSLGDIFQKLDKLNKAIDSYQQALKINPNFFWSNNSLGNIFVKQNNYDKAIEYFLQAGDIEPYNINVHKVLEKILRKQNKFQEAEYHKSIQLGLQENLVQTCIQIAEQAEKDNKLSKATASYKKVITVKSDFWSIYTKIGNLLRQQDKIDEEIKIYQQALKINPDLSNITQSLEEALIEHTKRKKVKIDGIPDDFELPPIVGENNDYTFIEDKVKEFVASGRSYSLPVSVIIPVYNRQEILARTLAGITHQTYPKDLIEVVVADDGSTDSVEEIILKYEKHLELIHVRQEDRGYRLSAVRNLGIRSSRHEHIILLDCDMLPEPQFVEEIMKYLHVSDRAAIIAHRRFVDPENVSDDRILNDINVALNLPDVIPENELWKNKEGKEASVDWRTKVYEETEYLKKEAYPFRAFASGHVGYSRNLIRKIGFYDEDFQHWGCEDTEFGYRAFNAGYYFIPVISAMGLHQEPPGGSNETNRKEGQLITQKIREQKCPAGWYRKYRPGELYEVPKVSIYIPAYNCEKFIKKAVDSVLNQTYTDLEVCICNDGSTDNTLKVLEENYADNPRVRWISQENGGIGKASNTAVRMCRGMYIGQLDSDDMLLPEAVETMVKFLDKNTHIGCVYGSCERIDAEDNYVKDEYNWSDFSRERLLIGMIVHHFRMFKKRDWMRTDGFDESLVNAVDYDMFLKLSEVCHFYHINEVMYQRRIHGKNTSIIHEKHQDQNTYLVIDNALRRIGKGDTWKAAPADKLNPRKIKLLKLN